MTLITAIEQQPPKDVTVYAYSDCAKRLDKFATVKACTPDELAESEGNEAIRRITFEQRYGREFADELQDAEAEAGIATIVWQIDGHEFTDARITRP